MNDFKFKKTTEFAGLCSISIELDMKLWIEINNIFRVVLFLGFYYFQQLGV